jgi:hypothetical protein
MLTFWFGGCDGGVSVALVWVMYRAVLWFVFLCYGRSDVVGLNISLDCLLIYFLGSSALLL